MNRQKSFDQEKNALYLVATPIGNLEEFTPRAVEVLRMVDVIAAEDTRNTLKLLTHFDIHTRMISHHQHNEHASALGIVRLLEEGRNVALVSDAGYPLISDPGQLVTQMVIDAGYPVIPISGPNAMLNALVASGLPTQPFLFYGFLKSQEGELRKELTALKDRSETLIFYEAPHRILKTLKLMYEIFGDRRMCLARELTKRHEEFIRGTIWEVLEVVEECKGEMVLVMEGNTQKEAYAMDITEIQIRIHEYIEEGLSSKEAIKKVAKESGLSRNDVYRHYHGIN